MPIKYLKPNPDNPRLIKDAAFKKLVKSLKDCPELFDARPCLVSNRTGENIILGGNMRFRASQELKWQEVPVIVMDGLTVDQEREISVKDNGDFGEWDWDILANEWDDLPLIEWGVPGDFECLSGSNEEKLEQDEVLIRPYEKIHVLVSVDVSSSDEVITLLDQLRKIEGVEIEQGAN